MTMFASERACRYTKYLAELYPGWAMPRNSLATGFYERQPSDDIEYPMDEVLKGLAEMHRAGLRRNGTQTGPGDLVAIALDQMLNLVRFARAVDTIAPEGAYDGLLNMEDARVMMKREGRA